MNNKGYLLTYRKRQGYLDFFKNKVVPCLWSHCGESLLVKKLGCQLVKNFLQVWLSTAHLEEEGEKEAAAEKETMTNHSPRLLKFTQWISSLRATTADVHLAISHWQSIIWGQRVGEVVRKDPWTAGSSQPPSASRVPFSFLPSREAFGNGENHHCGIRGLL